MKTVKKKKTPINHWWIFISCLLIATLPFKIVFQAKGLRWLYIFLCSFSISFVCTPLIRSIALKLDFCDLPNQRKVHKSKTPLLGGFAIYAAFIGSISTNFIFTDGLIPILLSSSIILILGTVDDIKELPALMKLFVQLIACLIICSSFTLEIFPIITIIGKGANVIITIFWIIGITNALNFLDGMDGLATGISCIISLFLGIIAFQTNQVTLGWISISIFGACLGFIPFNFHPKKPATIFLGDGGSTFLGFALSCLAVLGDWSATDPIVALTTPLLLFSVLIFDMIHTTVYRFKTGKVSTIKDWVEYVGRDHLHHRLESLFRSKLWSVLFIFLITISLGLAAIVLKQVRRVDALLLILQSIFMFFIISVLEGSGKKHERRKEGQVKNNLQKKAKIL